MPRTKAKPAAGDGGPQNVCRNSNGPRSNKHRRFDQAVLAVTDGAQHAGTIVERDGQWLAFDVADRLVGVFETLKAAMRALPARSAP